MLKRLSLTKKGVRLIILLYLFTPDGKKSILWENPSNLRIWKANKLLGQLYSHSNLSLFFSHSSHFQTMSTKSWDWGSMRNWKPICKKSNIFCFLRCYIYFQRELWMVNILRIPCVRFAFAINSDGLERFVEGVLFVWDAKYLQEKKDLESENDWV